MLEISHLSKIYTSGFWGNKRVEAVKDISFHVGEGEIFGLIGESGSGKTTLARMIGGFLKPSSGEIAFEGHNLVKAGAREWYELAASDPVCVSASPDDLSSPAGYLFCLCRTDSAVSSGPSYQRKRNGPPYAGPGWDSGGPVA